jgi:hypothetical protein
MNVSTHRIFFLTMFFLSFCSEIFCDYPGFFSCNPWSCEPQEEKPWCAPLNEDSVARDALASAAWNVLDLGRELFRWDSYKIIIATFIPVIIGKTVDERVNECFINRGLHRNKNQLNCFFQQFGRYGFVFPVFLGCTLSIAARSPDVRFTSRMFILGFPFVYLCKEIIKKWDSGQIRLRPWCEGFSREQRACGGFPSGHVAIYAYAAFLYGKRFGLPFALPLGALTALTGIAFINCNRHYVSQVVAGVGLGALFAYAADKVVEKRLCCEELCCGFDVCSDGKPALSLSCRF